MKNWLLLFLLIGSFTAFAQNVPPQAIAFQGVAIDPNGYPVPSMDEFGNPLRDEAIRIRFTIQDSDASSAVEHYSEEHAVVTDHYGRFSVEIGRGNSINANQFSDIIWSSGKKFLKVEIDLSGTGAQYELTSLQEMLRSLLLFMQQVLETMLMPMRILPTKFRVWHCWEINSVLAVLIV